MEGGKAATAKLRQGWGTLISHSDVMWPQNPAILDQLSEKM